MKKQRHFHLNFKVLTLKKGRFSLCSVFNHLGRAVILSVSLSLLCFGAGPTQAEETFPFVAKVTAKTANLRAGQNTNFESLGQLKAGDEVVVVGASFDWRKIKLPSQARAYVNAAFVKDLGQGIGEVTGNRLNIRAAALANASFIGQLKKGELVRIIEKKGDWYRIEPPDQSFGWVAKDFLVFKSGAIPPPRTQPFVPVMDKPDMSSAAPPLVDRAPVLVTAIGFVEDLGDKIVSPDIRHYLQSDGKVYALRGFRHVIDGFLNEKVKIEGKIGPGVKSDHPVVLVTKITLVL